MNSSVAEYSNKKGKDKILKTRVDWYKKAKEILLHVY